MKSWRCREFHFFTIGFLIGSSIILLPFYFYNKQQAESRQYVISRMNTHAIDEANEIAYQEKFNETLSNQLFSQVKILCMVMTMPVNHRTKAIHVMNTWGRRCNKIVFFSSADDLHLNTIVLPIEDTRDALWNKTKASFQHVYDNYLEDFDWFLKADDDNYIIVENIRLMLSQYNPATALYFGHRYAVEGVEEGYMAGGGYILSKKAVMKFAEKLVHNHTLCHIEGSAEDMEMGKCLAHSAIFVDCRDEVHQKRFFPVGVEEHMKKKVDPNYWYTRNQYYHATQGNVNCCSDTSTEFHYVSAHEMYLLEYFIYQVHPFGLDDHVNETLPKKFSLKEIIKASDSWSSSPNFIRHKNYHDLEPSEMY